MLLCDSFARSAPAFVHCCKSRHTLRSRINRQIHWSEAWSWRYDDRYPCSTHVHCHRQSGLKADLLLIRRQRFQTFRCDDVAMRFYPLTHQASVRCIRTFRGNAFRIRHNCRGPWSRKRATCRRPGCHCQMTSRSANQPVTPWPNICRLVRWTVRRRGLSCHRGTVAHGAIGRLAVNKIYVGSCCSCARGCRFAFWCGDGERHLAMIYWRTAPPRIGLLEMEAQHMGGYV